MRTYARQATIKGKVCVNCGQRADDTHGHNINQCVDALEARKQDLMTRYLLEGKLHG